MSEAKETYLCKWCNTIKNSVIKEYDQGRLTWVGCVDCYKKRKELENNAEANQ